MPNLKSNSQRPAVTIATLQKMKREGEKIASITAYDATFAALVDEAGIDLVLVGDSLGMVVQGHSTTVPVSVNDMVYHSAMVARGLTSAFLVSDLPFLSFTTPELALKNAARLMQEGAAHMVKLEGRQEQLPIVETLASADIPVCAHIGLRPQSIHKFGGYKVQGKGDEAANLLVREARLFEEAGADMLLLECVSSVAASRVKHEVNIPVIGIGAGVDVDGQILVLYDVLGITRGRLPGFAKDYTKGGIRADDAVRAYVEAVKSGAYPAPEHCFA
jgi:3-methyl-2-oxobutanoate hydroxymethyltransferase